ncbi:rhodanese-like domain-containing protein [Roseateles chitosanitabidus]|uniref:rhodanese-like domain-containing protein n=1 Tax=Roseateles chitosanitabidus TaxID=65048 RepID=UPI000833E758|nr:rhodanese-like domain-containing protein [Roseateles chitosanitabidus]MBO9689175.1 rhodanese-like domain-containing protein [Roseateles chitosanitabidus]
MKFLIENWYLVLTALVSGGLLAWTSLKDKSAGVSTAEAVRLINREKGVLIDVSDAAEYAAGHANGARSVPLELLTGTETPIKQLPTNKALPVVLMCKTGARAQRAAGILRKQGYANVVVVAGGLKAWREASLPVEKSAA